jgi:hypothetical protein
MRGCSVTKAFKVPNSNHTVQPQREDIHCKSTIMKTPEDGDTVPETLDTNSILTWLIT